MSDVVGGDPGGTPVQPEGSHQMLDPRHHARRRALARTFKVFATLIVVYFLILNIPGLRNAVDQLSEVKPGLLVLGLVLELLALFCYSLMTRAALGPVGHHMSALHLFRIQLSTRALSSLVPGGSAAGSALGYRLMVASSIPGPDAGFALATAGLASAVVLNFILWAGLIVSIPLRGVNPVYGSAAIAGIILMGIAVAIIFGLIEGQERSERILRSVARRLRLNEDRAGEAIRHVGARMQELTADRALLRRLVFWASANWLIDATALWVFLRAFGGSVPLDGLIVAFGLANVLAAIPITPGGLGIVEGTYVPVLVGFGLPRATAVVGVVSYRIAQFWLPILIGGVCYLSLRIGPWAIARNKLEPLRNVVATMSTGDEDILNFSERFSAKERTGQLRQPSVEQIQASEIQNTENPQSHD
ncbi:MAG: lysylphosphatidylglycerol synthase transmembrane domain-containing protein [Actinomycetota bacterium]|nr:lysylphosphatidylglycerol synthase transmembrane domain-containing protein [Actinomycetota bacterium]